MAYKYTIGQPFIYPKNSLSFAQNFLHMCFAVPWRGIQDQPGSGGRARQDLHPACRPRAERASTSTVRIAGSSGANPFACIAAGIACLWGPAHGGANEAALAMLAGIGTVDKIPDFIKRVKDKNSEVRLMGFGASRLQELRSPRQDHAEDVSRRAGGDRPRRRSDAESRLGTGERSRLSDPYFIDRKLYPNVDFYSGHQR